MRRGLPFAALAALVLAPQWADPYWDFLLASALVYMIAALSVNVLFGQAGMIGLFPAALLGTGAYFAAIAAKQGAPWLVALVAGIAASAAVGAAVGLAGTRLRGMTFGIVTLAFALAAETIAFRHGFLGIDPAFGATLGRPESGIADFLEDTSYYYLVLFAGLLAWLVVCLHERGRPGRAWRALRDDELAALAMGVRAGRYRIWASALAGAIGGLAGVLFLSLQGQANVESFTAVQSLLIFTAAMTAGTRSVYGAILAGLLMIAVPELLSDAGIDGDVVPLVFAAGVLVSLRGADGITGMVAAAARRLAHARPTSKRASAVGQAG